MEIKVLWMMHQQFMVSSYDAKVLWWCPSKLTYVYIVYLYHIFEISCASLQLIIIFKTVVSVILKKLIVTASLMFGTFLATLDKTQMYTTTY